MDLHDLEELARAKIAEFGLDGWTFRFGRAKRRLGSCDYRARQIEISAYYAYYTPDHEVKDTLLHEIAHALAGPRSGHGPRWKAIAARIGATPRACDNSPDTVVPPGDWQAVCPGCGRTHHRYRRPIRLSGYLCRCAAKSPLTYTFRGTPVKESDLPPTAHWQAVCSACGTIHRRARRPKAGLWQCGCPGKQALTWTHRTPAREPNTGTT